LRRFDLHLPAVSGKGIMSRSGCFVEDEVIPVGGDDFTDASHQVPIGGELATGEKLLELGHQAVELLDQGGYPVYGR